MKKLITYINRHMVHAAILFMVLTVFSCSKWDDYKKYTVGGETIYPGTLDSLKVLSGKGRVRVSGLLNADPTVSVVKIFWNTNKDSLVYEIKRSVTGNRFEQTITLPESVTTFTVYTYDLEGNRSVPVYVVGKSFGDTYRRSLTNRYITSVTYTAAKDSTTINWDAAAATALTTEVLYPQNPSGNIVKLDVPVKDVKTALTGFDFQKAKFSYRTFYRPDSTCIDTFATQYTIR
ncbi:MAG TPA: DUF4998 domain-containing protein [Niastella sp.]|nr:DUF4998 domain-containing protein [Niastella sp.]